MSIEIYFRHLVELKDQKRWKRKRMRASLEYLSRVMELFYLDLKSPSGEWMIHEKDLQTLIEIRILH